MNKYLLVLIGGALGAVSRYILGTLVAKWYLAVFPLGTFVINVTGSFLIGVLMMIFLNRPFINANWRLFVVTGILGGYTTFSSFEWETFFALREGASIVAIYYVVLSVGLGLVAVWVGAVTGNHFWPRS